MKKNDLIEVLLICLFSISLVVIIMDYKKGSTEIKLLLKKDSTEIKLLLKKDSIITCPTDNREVYKVTENIFSGDAIKASQFEGIKKQKSPQIGDIVGANTGCDLNPFYSIYNVVYCIHTNQGWISNRLSVEKCNKV